MVIYAKTPKTKPGISSKTKAKQKQNWYTSTVVEECVRVLFRNT
jgi:hypothetical protein